MEKGKETEIVKKFVNGLPLMPLVTTNRGFPQKMRDY